eukprot:TRINITY_DN21085_c0_g5_i2.p1 TRINITY_DN21085_c0_g5~~TRINITY_DN21085_c0_g5_i2.p1  ORF type:complete len:146 (-),score=12.93 TRINITY_DN21085_c0_g5_i2:42-479(-)
MIFGSTAGMLCFFSHDENLKRENYKSGHKFFQDFKSGQEVTYITKQGFNSSFAFQIRTTDHVSFSVTFSVHFSKIPKMPLSLLSALVDRHYVQRHQPRRPSLCSPLMCPLMPQALQSGSGARRPHPAHPTMSSNVPITSLEHWRR